MINQCQKHFDNMYLQLSPNAFFTFYNILFPIFCSHVNLFLIIWFNLTGAERSNGAPKVDFANSMKTKKDMSPVGDKKIGEGARFQNGLVGKLSQECGEICEIRLLSFNRKKLQQIWIDIYWFALNKYRDYKRIVNIHRFRPKNLFLFSDKLYSVNITNKLFQFEQKTVLNFDGSNCPGAPNIFPLDGSLTVLMYRFLFKLEKLNTFIVSAFV